MLLRAACVALAVLALSTPARAAWHRAVSSHFVIYSDQAPEKLEAYAKKLEAFDQAVRYARGVPDDPVGNAGKITVFAVEDIAAIQRLYGGYGVGGFYISRAGEALAFVPIDTSPGTRVDITAENVFFHEYAHHLMYQSITAALPLWLTEGFAEFFSTAIFEPDGSVGLGAPARHRARILLTKLEVPLTLEQMLQGSLKGLNGWQVEELYGRGWLLTHYLTFNPARKGQLEQYVQGIQQGKPALQAARAAFGDLGKLNGQLRDYVRSKRFPYVTVPASKIKLGRISIEPLSPGEAAFMEVRMRSRRGVTEVEARKLVVAARRIAAGYPADAQVQTALAEAELDAGNSDEAIAAADRALAVDPRSVEALLYKGRALVSKAERGGSSAEDWKPIQRVFLAANKADPQDPRPLIDYYSSFAKAGLKPTRNAATGLLYAFELAPQDNSLRWLVARELIAQERGAEASKVLQPLAHAPHGGKNAERAAAILAKIDAGDLTGATDLLKQNEKADAEEKEKKKGKDAK